MHSNNSVKVINKFEAQKKLSYLWFIASAFLILIFVLFSINGKFNSDNKDAWQWLLQQITPILSLITAAFLSDSRDISAPKKIKKHYFVLTFSSSIVYFFILIVTVFSLTWSMSINNISAYEHLHSSSVYLIPILGVVTALLGIFFAKEES